MPDAHSDADAPRVGRRRFLTRGAITAAVAASGATALASEPAAAANGNNLVIGGDNAGTTTTWLTGSQLWVVDGNQPASVVGEHSTPGAVGVPPSPTGATASPSWSDASRTP
jgi:hypothetical protein